MNSPDSLRPAAVSPPWEPVRDAPALHAADEASIAADSPARRLQENLERSWGEAQPRWSARRTLGFVIATNTLLWAGLIYGLRALI
ncbi:hypothetical protein DJ021_13640 [Phenylobacterium hankyongense]|uniref:Uncharacterized protein n=1 Tax=Phenylobacterium hankyongense TaxID=1813876 RepID=A0A328B4I8_9CAUL|nr:hypothetical protein DJ021_13640 [Phenylobacterium hankyongense]